MELAPGTTVDKYVVEELLGRGGMASVYRIRHESLRSVHALKVLDLPSRQIRERLQSEGMYQANLRHPNVVSVLDVVSIDGSPALVMEFVDGPSLEGLLRLHRPTIEQIDEVARGILKGVRAAHRVGLIHRDLKPANVLMARTDDGFVPKIADFGLAKMTQGDGSDPGRTRTGAMMGTPAYMAPEQFRSAKEVDERADIYALGVTLYELCTGRRPVQSDDLFDIYEQVKAGTFPRPTELVPELPERMEKAILGALVVDPKQRIATVDALYATWVGLSELASDRAAAWDRSLLDSMSGASSAANSAGTPQTWQTGLASQGGGSLAPSVPPQRRPTLARRMAPFVAVMGLALTLMLVVGGTGIGGLALLATTAGPLERGAAEPLPAVDASPAGSAKQAPAAAVPEHAPAPSPAPRPASDPVRSPARADDGRTTPLPVKEEKVGRDEPAQLADNVGASEEVVAGRWEVVGAGDGVVLVGADGRELPPGPVLPGTYTLRYTLGGEVHQVEGVVVPSGRALVVRCDPTGCSPAPEPR